MNGMMGSNQVRAQKWYLPRASARPSATWRSGSQGTHAAGAAGPGPHFGMSASLSPALRRESCHMATWTFDQRHGMGPGRFFAPLPKGPKTATRLRRGAQKSWALESQCESPGRASPLLAASFDGRTTKAGGSFGLPQETKLCAEARTRDTNIAVVRLVLGQPAADCTAVRGGGEFFVCRQHE